MAGGFKVLLNAGVGLTVRDTEKVVELVQLLAETVYTYTTVTGAVPVLVSISFGPPAPFPASLLIPATTALVQSNVAPGVVLAGVYINVEPLQIAGGVKLLLKTGRGLTLTTTLNGDGLVQPSANTVYEYVTSIGAADVFIRVSFGLPVPFPAGLLIPAIAALVHINEAPEEELVGA